MAESQTLVITDRVILKPGDLRRPPSSSHGAMSYAHRDTPVLAELCTLLIDNLYGELASVRIWSALRKQRM